LVLGEKKAREIADEFFWMISRTILGQTVELKWMRDNKRDLAVEDVFFILESKTAYYTISGPMRLGAILAGASRSQLEAIYQFGRPLGRCFQIVDDLLDLTSDFSGLKKQRGNDIYEGKRTVMLVHLLKRAKPKDRKKLLMILAKPREKKLATEVSWVIEAMKNYGSIDYGKRLAEKFKAEARDVFNTKLSFLSHQPSRDQLIAGMEFILQRDH
jgi:geranylgeranyl diphosphate synthase type II